MEIFNACTYCGSDQLVRGPRGGACANVFCIRCGAKFNVVLQPGMSVVLVDTLTGPNTVLAKLFRMAENRTQEFDCIECGRHIVMVCGPPTSRCAACQAMPGWFRDPELARIIDPDRARESRDG